MKFSSAGEFFFKVNQVFHWILAAPLALFIVLSLEWRDDTWKQLVQDRLFSDIILYSFSIGAVALWYLGFRSFRDQTGQVPSNSDLKQKLEYYAKGFVRMQLFYTASSLLALLGLYLTGSNFFAIYYIALLFYISITRPAPGTVSRALGLSDEERDILRRKKPLEEDGNLTE